jgi:hypothetical protein
MSLSHPSRHQLNPLVNLPERMAAHQLGVTFDGLRALVDNGLIEELTPGRISVESMRVFAKRGRAYDVADRFAVFIRTQERLAAAELADGAA